MEFVHRSVSSFAADCADRIVNAIEECLKHRERCHIALSGGSTPNDMFDQLAARQLPWQRVEIWQVDERVAPQADPARNANGLLQHLVDQLSIPPRAVHLIPVHLPVHQAVSNYANLLGTRCLQGLDVIHLGLGEDGHTASWPPGDPICEEHNALCAATAGLFNGYRRVSLTPRAVNQAHARLMCVSGVAKTHALEQLIQGGNSIPAHRLIPHHTTVMFAGMEIQLPPRTDA